MQERLRGRGRDPWKYLMPRERALGTEKLDRHYYLILSPPLLRHSSYGYMLRYPYSYVLGNPGQRHIRLLASSEVRWLVQTLHPQVTSLHLTREPTPESFPGLTGQQQQKDSSSGVDSSLWSNSLIYYRPSLRDGLTHYNSVGYPYQAIRVLRILRNS